jgi:Uma2 family endonuclease
MTTQPSPSNLTADTFMDWAARQPRGRFELVGGEVVAMAPERAGHTRTKARTHRALEEAIARSGLGCEAFPDGMTVRIDDLTVYEPDALIRCGARTPDDAVEVHDPVVLVEVVSRSTRAVDSGAKLVDYFSLPSVRHYLVIDLDTRSVTRHARSTAGEISTSILREGRLDLDPPGLAVEVADFFPL